MLSPPVLAPISGRVCAVVVTYNRQELLTRCLRALQEQTRAPDAILVVDNASTDGTRAVLEAHFPQVETLFLSQNGGGAGGFHAGLRHAFERGFDWFWIMDDDGTPQSDCLQLLLQQTQSGDATPAVILPVQEDNLGRFYGIMLDKFDVASRLVERGEPERGKFIFTFVGPLISRVVVEKIGLPLREFFIWLDDFEYALRIHKNASLPVVVVPKARFSHDPGGVVKEVCVLGRRSLRAQQPAWKIYYGTRNGFYIISRAHPNRREWLPFFAKEMKLLLGDLLYEPNRWPRAKMRLRGLRDGALGRMGRRH